MHRDTNSITREAKRMTGPPAIAQSHTDPKETHPSSQRPASKPRSRSARSLGFEEHLAWAEAMT
jgi:hypothetical protein